MKRAILEGALFDNLYGGYMEIIIGGARTGKTRKCIELAAKEQAVIVCHSQGEANNIKRQAGSMGLVILDPITFYDFASRTKLLGKPLTKYIIDNADLYLAYAKYMSQVIGITLAEENPITLLGGRKII